MPISRKAVNRVRYVLEDLLPPALRDSALFVPLMYLAFGRRAKKMMAFRDAVRTMGDEEYASYYAAVTPLSGEVDLNRRCIERIVADVVGESVLDAGCGRGYLAKLLARTCPQRACVGVDLAPPENRDGLGNLAFVSGWLGRLPFEEGSFDTVTCTHTLEHILGIDAAIADLRRVARRRLILVVPREREYKYALNLHVHFFAYRRTFLNRIGPPPGRFVCEEIDGDIYYREDFDSKSRSVKQPSYEAQSTTRCRAQSLLPAGSRR